MKNNIISILIPLVVFLYSCTRETNENKKPSGNFNNTLTQEEIAKARITPEVLWKFGRVTDHRLSPDGKTVIYGVTRYDVATNLKMTDIYSIPVNGGDAIKLTDGKYSCTNQRFIPGKSQIAYLSSESGSAQIWIMNTDGSGKKQISEIPEGINGFEFA